MKKLKKKFFVNFRKPFEEPKLKSAISLAQGKNSKTFQLKKIVLF
jgi:hypothetical protein